ncbi:hypothetical protein CWI80_10955 [Pseudidiomarina sediminum]|uniref:Uncharacterized protein n=1 Tax=Pseudidiomarina sediminum TaxID=431675 RepID=A0A432Z0N9_9GAMM|nr:hypothetical protein [Pseudidiomarina sediminum]MBY6064825.1 hypothetical protein [Pseudidiomarina sediminum]RUO69734.1 hypothetical protein CWI80_10955 [Pseudidiomarina sediminum]
MRRQSNWLWIILAIVAVVFFGDELLGLLGAVVGIILSIGITGLVLVAIAIAAFSLVLVIGGSIAFALVVAMFALAAVLFSWLWPYLLLLGIIYLLVRKRPKPV